MSVLEKLKTRRSYPVKIGDVEIKVRAMTIGELNEVDKIADDLKTGFVMGSCLCDDAGQPAFTRRRTMEGLEILSEGNVGVEEKAEDFARRVMDALTDISTETIKEISRAIAEIGSIDIEGLRKN